MNINKQIQTERLILRSYKLSDAREFTKLGIIFYSTGKLNTPVKVRKYFTHVSKSRNEFTLGIFLREKNILIGNIEFCHMNWFDFKAGEISYHLHKKYWGNGYATEAGEGLINYCFKTLKLHKIYADTEPSNLASQKVLEKLDFKLEGTIRDKRQKKGKWVDELDYGLLKNEWLSNN